MFCRSVSCFISIFVTVVIATTYSNLHTAAESSAEVTINSLETGSPDSSTMEPHEEVKETTPTDLGSLLDAGDGAVVTLVAGDTRLVVHRAVLAARSPVFAAMFQRITPGAGSDEVTISDVEGPVLRQLLSYIYTLQAPQLPSMAPQLLAAADIYGLPGLKADCERQMAAQLSVETAAATAVLALRHSSDCLRTAAVAFIKAHMAPVVLSQAWADAMRAQPEAMLQVSRLLFGPSAESSTPATGGSGTTLTTQPHSDRCRTPLIFFPHAAACHTTPPADDCVSCVWRLSGVEKRRRLMNAAREGAMEELQTLLTGGADARARDWDNMTALHWAAKEGQVDAVKCLLAAGADMQAREQYMYTPLHLAAALGHVEAARRLVERGTEVDARDIEQNTPLHWAAEGGHAAVVRFLLESSAYHSARNQWGHTPLHLAAKGGHTEVATALLDAGADEKARDDDGYTPEADARRKEQWKMMKTLGWSTW